MRRATMSGLLVILVLGIGGYAVISRVRREGAAMCQVCSRPIHRGQMFVLQLDNGKRERTCCPRCGLHFEQRAPERVRAAWATDFASGRLIEAERAVYVEGSDIMTCCRPTPLREPGIVYERHWDRCLPSLIAFEREADARAFQAEHGGRVLTYLESMTSVRER
ncbi:MAG: nitrous oxide reductase accessory protein NosL [Blastocatellia bacterium]|nr:nitrous oxide reductase accessory protein NosL [Blastocatellia bacterium]MDW8256478.1 hypothetical protein [Acidobacteriota bacterium]